ncbi:MAG TPA: hypothetical protein VHG09_14405 [Longimicrobiales bacterium]|nr:hypothetical protein [Longimicrobiales bacterium]
MSGRGPSILLVLSLLASTACDRTPVDPLDNADVAAIAGTKGERVSASTLPGLLYSAIRSVHDEHGIAAASTLVRDLALIQHRLDSAPIDERPALRRELRNEQLRIVLRVHDGDVVTRTIRSVRQEAARLQARRHTLAASGIAAPDVNSIMEDVPLLLARARSASDEIAALDAATRAATRTDRVREALAGAARLPSLTDLVADASTVRAGRRLDGLIQESNELQVVADRALRSGEREQARAAAEAARSAQIRVVLAGLRPDAVADVIRWSQHRVREQEKKLGAEAALRDVSRLERMNASAADMLQRADIHLRRGRSAAALDLAAHAVDLLNALEVTLTDN